MQFVLLKHAWLSDDISIHVDAWILQHACVVRLDRSQHGGGVLRNISDLFINNTVFVGITFECINV